jgi:hypothetical protein
LRISRLFSFLEAKTIVSSAAATLAIWILFARVMDEYFGNEFRLMILRVFAKCPGLPYGAYSGGPDYIDISIDIGLTVVAAVFIYLTIRDIRRKRKANAFEEEGSAENPGEEKDES